MEKESEGKHKAFYPDLKGRDPEDVGAQLSSQRTGMSFQRTRLSADRTLMSVIRTSLSLITFGFAIFQFFQRWYRDNPDIPESPYLKSFTLILVILGVIMLILGIIYQVNFMMQIRKERAAFMEDGLLPVLDKYPLSMTLIIAVLLLMLGITAIISMLVQLT